ncbi:RNA-binding protein 34 [Quillaja saponaria]|uniref:RNA-binding protein 34 n=1 Tax=Quillaja saponaria TaxID=32244 RepID=A0AAD7P6K9_QUISA|nr:RNA-binding protein 34 [Quillaja saponaria]
MGKKKEKHTEQQETTKSDGLSASSNVFRTIFGDVVEENAVSSLFSDKNPFRRKPQGSGLGLGSGSSKVAESRSNGGSDIHDSDEQKKRKRNNEKKYTGDSNSVVEASETPVDTKKSKKDKRRDLNLVPDVKPDLGPQPIGDAVELNQVSEEAKNENHGLGLQNGGDINMEGKVGDDEEKKRRKKRKRDEIEKEYEVRKYGAAVEKEEENGGEGLGGKVAGSKRKALDNSADMLVSKDGFDDESKLLRTIFVGNLPLKLKKKTLLKEFSKFGEVESVRIRSVPLLDTKKPRKGAILSKKINDSADSVHAYVVFTTEQAAQASLAHNMAVVLGNHIRVDRACPPRKKVKGDNVPLYDNKRTVFVGNLPFDVKDEELYKLFCGIANLESSIEAVRVIRDPHINIGKGIAYVLFKTREAANLVVKKRNLKLRDRDLRLCFAKLDSTSSKKSNPSPARTAITPGKKSAMCSRSPSNSNDRPRAKIDMSYQGLRANKAGAEKKFKTQKAENPNERKRKRPAVAARKTKAKFPKDGGPSKQAGMKRKLDSRTPESSQRPKKVKKFR